MCGGRNEPIYVTLSVIMFLWEVGLHSEGRRHVHPRKNQVIAPGGILSRGKTGHAERRDARKRKAARRMGMQFYCFATASYAATSNLRQKTGQLT